MTPEGSAGILRKVIDFLGRGPTVPAGAALFAELLFHDLGDAEAGKLGDSDLAAVAKFALEFLTEKPIAGHKLRFRHIGGGGTGPAHATLIEIVNDDMPFLVDSVMDEIQSRDVPVQMVLHPILKTRRTAAGRLEAVTGPGDRDWREGQESFIQVHLEPISDQAAGQLITALDRILGHVRLAVTDWRAMLDRVERVIADYQRSPPPVSELERTETVEFLQWLTRGNFTFLGVRELAMVGGEDTGDLETIPESGLGILRDPDMRVLRRGNELMSMTPAMRRFYFQPAALIISKANSVATVHRRAHMDYIGAKLYGAGGKIFGELRIAGLFTSVAYTSDAGRIPFIRHKIQQVMVASGYPPDSHNGKALLNILETFPRDELFQISTEELRRWSTGILDLELRPRVRIFSRVDDFDRFASALVYVPRDRFTTEVRQRIGEQLASAYNCRVSSFYPFFTQGPLVRIHFILARLEGARPAVDEAELEGRVRATTQNWQDRLAGSLRGRQQGSKALDLLTRYGEAFPSGYRDSFGPERAMEDMARIEQLSMSNPVGIDFYRAPDASPGQVRVAVYRLGAPIPLSDRVPVFENFGFRVIDERSWNITPEFAGVRRDVRLHDMVLETPDGQDVALDREGRRLEECFLAVWRGDAENDSFNRLVRLANMDWRGAAIARAYGAYLRQIGAPFGLRYLADTLIRHASVTADLAALFAVRFDPANGLEPDQRADKEAEIKARIEEALSRVQSLDEDRILRHYLNLVLATKRTNFYQTNPSGDTPAAIAFKLASAEVDGLPAPKPYREIWVYSPRVEGVHLRFAPIARGGIRWSDRAQDFRTEVLGLVKAQQVKNTVIIPAGAKGGFVPKRLPLKGGREEIQREGIAAYELFITTLLDLTDNIVEGKVVPPAKVVRYDGDDPYLVVAADKGTATFSDIANTISARHGFWLSDAFASGGSAGYDHKKMAITARGGWECVKRHFREMDVDIQTTPFRVIGVGDMSGDVFGNAMLLSPQIRLVAAFDHRDIFIDPDPDPTRSSAERKRVFELPRSSWQDYDKAKISKGGGIFPRSAKSIPVNPEIAALLGIAAPSLPPDELMRAILKLPADLAWFGGIGTFVKASTETNEQVGDRINDTLRINAGELRVKVVGEGANLAMTQRARIEYGMAGGRLNTDFIDNSAGVNSSDQEVNIKIALGQAVAGGRLDIGKRNTILASMTDDVADACLRNNYLQSLALSLAHSRGLADMGFQQRLMRDLEREGELDRTIEYLPSDAEIASRVVAGQPLTRPELAVLLSYAKINLTHRLLASSLPDDPYFQGALRAYFPPTLREAYKGELDAHRLRREIVTTIVTNETINRGGPTMIVKLEEETGRAAPAIVMAFQAVRSVFGLGELWRKIDALDAKIEGAIQLGLYRDTQELVLQQTAWFLRHAKFETGLGKVVEAFQPGVQDFSNAFATIMTRGQRTALDRRVSGLVAKGLDASLARELAALGSLSEASDATLVATETGKSVIEAAKVQAEVSGHFRIGELESAANALTLTDYFDRLAMNSTLAIIGDAKRSITADVLRWPGGQGLTAWIEQTGAPAARAKASLDEVIDSGVLTLARLTVAASQMRDLAAR